MSEAAELQIEDPGPMTAAKLRALLRRKYPADQYALLHEVRDAPGFAAKRSADVIAIGLWPSRGCMVEGMEIKISRADWLRELKKPQKAEAFFANCDRWWIVASSSEIVKSGELPPAWGLMVPRASGLTVLKPAQELSLQPIDRFLLAAMMKRATSTALEDPEVVAAIDAKVASETALIKAGQNYDLQRLQRDHDELKKSIQTFQAASGVEIDRYSGQRIGEAVRVVLAGEHKYRLRELSNMKRTARGLLEWLDKNVPDQAEADGA